MVRRTLQNVLPTGAVGRLIQSFGLAVALSCGGCRMVETATELPVQAVRSVMPGRNQPTPPNPEELQQQLLRFADEFSAQLAIGTEQLRWGTNGTDRAMALRWKIALATEVCALASGPNPVANLLDLTVFVTALRMALEEPRHSELFGDSARSLSDNCRNAETKVWQAVRKILTPEQEDALRQAIVAWREEHPAPADLLASPSVGFAAHLAENGSTDPAKSMGLLGLLKMDPLAAMDPAIREVARSRLLAERALFVTQKLPMLLRWQTELLGVRTTELPAVRQLVADATRIADAVDRFSVLAAELPDRIGKERAEILRALETQERALTPLVQEVRGTLVEGTRMSTSIDTTLRGFDALMQRFGVGETNVAPASSPAVEAEPFRIRDYGETAARLEAAARQLTELLAAFDRTLGSTNMARLSEQVGPAARQAQAGARELLDDAFRKGLLLILAAALAALAYRWLSHRLGLAGARRD
ncbi:MAG: hypothetical protein JNL97_03035 [Verrucomicrobiales bacterium]|nr:hypothetical protein [Verrucomicrobiales bacterium]